MNFWRKYARKLKEDNGAVMVLVAILTVSLFGMGALAVDIGHLAMVKNQLQNAADAGALAGAAELYNVYGTAVNEGANQTAFDFATSNFATSVAGEISVDINDPLSNDGDIQRGHWSFATRTFTPNSSLLATELYGKSTAELDADTNFINAVRVVARRQENPANSFLARIFGNKNFEMESEAVAYIGFAGKIQPHDVDQPIVICEEAIKDPDTGNYSCNIGRMINSGNNVESNETGGWTDFNQDDSPCSGGTNANDVRSLVCADGNPNLMVYGGDVATNGGEVQSAFKDLYDCWVANTNKERLWNLSLPVVTCPGNNITTCQEIVGIVNLNIVWINDQNDPHYNNAPTQMENPDGTIWTPSLDATTGELKWQEFVQNFNLKNVDGSDAPYQQKAIYYLPDCSEHELAGVTGGKNFGVLAKIPVLVD